MKVLMVNTPKAPKFKGGDLRQMRETAKALATLQVTVGESFDPEPDATGFDLAHVFNIRTIDATTSQVRHLSRFGIPIVLSPVYLNVSFAHWGIEAVRDTFGTPCSQEELAQRLDALRTYSHVVRRGDQEFTARDEKRPHPQYDEWQRQILEHVDYLLPNSVLEMNALVNALRVSHLPFSVVPYAADPLVFLDPDPAPFVRQHGLSDFVLQVGRVEASKNPLLAAYALRELDLRLVLIGGQLQPKYIDMCRQFGPGNLLIIPHLPPHLLSSAYAAARVHVLPSWIETCGLTTMEAALGNCNVVASTAGYELEYYRDLAYYCDPADADSIRRAVVAAYENYSRDAARRLQLKRLILSEYTWQRAAEITHQAYCRTLHGRKDSERGGPGSVGDD